MQRKQRKEVPFRPAPIVRRLRVVDEKDLTAGNTRETDLDDIREKLDEIQKRLDEFYKMYLKDRIHDEERESRLKHKR